MKKNLNILICPLEWGLGHAARMIALAARLKEMDHNITIAAGRELHSFFRSELPGIPCIDFPGFRPRYSRHLPQYLMILPGIPVLVYHIISEHYRLRKIISENKTDIVISDNRFGLWNRKVTTVYVTHQLRIPFPKAFRFLEFMGILLHRVIIKRFNYCLIPDLPGEINLSGRLSHDLKLPGNTLYAGILSRFSRPASEPVPAFYPGRHRTVILSGPEPQRSLLLKRLTPALLRSDIPVVILGGNPSAEDNKDYKEGLTYFSHLPAREMKEMIEGSDMIITRSGYTTIMELISLNRSALLIPTPGQTEQEYLARSLQKKGWFTTIRQKDLKKNDFPFSGIRADIPAEEIISISRILLEDALGSVLKEAQK